MRNNSSRAAVPAIMLLALAGSSIDVSAAPTQAQQQAIRSSCQSDYRTYCASVPTGGSEALQCLEKNLASLSSSCQQAVKAATAGSPASTGEGSGLSGSSSSTAAPATTAPAGGSSAAASSGNQVIIVLEPGQAAALMRQACGTDYRAHCSGKRIIGGAALGCLVSHGSSLSGSCKTALGKLGQKF